MTTPANDPDSLGSSPKTKTYAFFGADIDLVAEGGTVCRRVRINGAGSGVLAYTLADGSSDTPTGLRQGDVLDVQLRAILASGTSVTSVTVFW